MVTEYIKRGQVMGFDERGNLLYKRPYVAEEIVLSSEEDEDESTES